MSNTNQVDNFERNLIVCLLIFFAGIICMLTFSGCNSVKKMTDITVSKTDSTVKTVKQADSAGKSEVVTNKDNITTTVFSDFFMTDADSGEAYLELDTNETEVFENSGIKISATKDSKGGIKLNYVDKPKKAHGKGSTTSQSKEQTTAKTESKVKTNERAAVSVSHEDKKTVKNKHSNRTVTSILIWAILILLAYVLFRIIKAYFFKR